MTSNRILVIDEDDVLGKAVRRALEWIDATEEVVWLRPAEDVLAMARAERFATILLGASGDALKLLAALSSDAMGEPPVFLIADQVSEAMAADALNQGAVDCIPRSRFMVGGLPKVVVMALEQARLQHAVEQATGETIQLDSSTQLGNGSLLMRDVARAIAAAERSKRPFCLLFIELERVKSRHVTAVDVPPEIAPEFAQRLRKTARGTDLFFQLAPRRFAALMDAMEGTYSTAFAKRVRSAALMPFRIGTDVIELDARIGVTAYPDDGKTPEALLRAAEQALKNAMQSFEGIATAAAVPRVVRRGP
ncbi:MAG TPA: diguanylate cyclase [Xanthomonadaceae bacterium]|jgi:diguanylate cyclase (GGDEF)-like protein|nr:diguanylate cyclase [Xanthomonadaceae bacterium]